MFLLQDQRVVSKASPKKCFSGVGASRGISILTADGIFREKRLKLQNVDSFKVSELRSRLVNARYLAKSSISTTLEIGEVKPKKSLRQ